MTPRRTPRVPRYIAQETPRRTPRAPRPTGQESPRHTPRTAVIYTRVSSREQEQEGFSLDAQAKLLRDYANRKGLEIVRGFRGRGDRQGTGRKQFAEMVAFFQRNRAACNVLLVEKDGPALPESTRRGDAGRPGIHIHFVKEGTVLSKDAKSQDKLMHDIRLAIARNYSENLREEVNKGMTGKQNRARTPDVPLSDTEITWVHVASNYTPKRRISPSVFLSCTCRDVIRSFPSRKTSDRRRAQASQRRTCTRCSRIRFISGNSSGEDTRTRARTSAHQPRTVRPGAGRAERSQQAKIQQARYSLSRTAHVCPRQLHGHRRNQRKKSTCTTGVAADVGHVRSHVSASRKLQTTGARGKGRGHPARGGRAHCESHGT